MKTISILILLLSPGTLLAQGVSPTELLKTSKQSFISIRPEVFLFSQTPTPQYEIGEFKIPPKPGIAIGYGKRYRLYKNLGVEIGIFGGITRFSYAATAPSEEFPDRDYTYEQHESLVNPYLSIPILLNYQHPLNNKYLLTVFGGGNLKAFFIDGISSGLMFSNAPRQFDTGEVFEVSLIFLNRPINAGILTGAGIGRILPNHNILQLNIWANIGLSERVRGYYNFYDQQFDQSGKIQNHIVGSGTIQSKGSMVGTEIRYTLTGIRKRLKALQ